MKHLNSLSDKIAHKKHIVGVIGLGYVGLPLVNAMCKKNINVIGFDVDQTKIDMINELRSYIGGVSDADLKNHITGHLLDVTTDFSLLKKADIIVICVPTPLDSDKTPDLSYVENTTKAVAQNLRNGQMVILESTTYPGTVTEIMRPILDIAAQEKGGIDYFLAYSPEREDPGNPNFETSSTPKLVGAENQSVRDVCVKFYAQFIKEIVPVSSIEVAEAAKITENVFRAVNIALVNELKVIYDRMGIDVWEVIDAAATKPFGFMPFYPGPGIGGHCIPIDPIYLSWRAEQIGQKTRFIELSAAINDGMTDYIIHKTADALDLRNPKNFTGKRALLIGLAYKKNVSDQRESPAFPLMLALKSAGADVHFHDPFIPQILPSRHYTVFEGLYSQDLSAKMLPEYDVVIIVTNHDNIDYDIIYEHAPLIVDTRNVYANTDQLTDSKIIKA